MADLDAVMEIESSAYDFPWTQGIFRDCLRVGYCCWCYEIDGLIQGYGVMSVAAGESHILNISVRPESQRQGIGSKLMKHFLQLARRHDADTVMLEVRPSNKDDVAKSARISDYLPSISFYWPMVSAQDFGHFVVAQFLQMAEHEDLAIRLTELFQGQPHVRQQLLVALKKIRMLTQETHNIPFLVF